MANTLSAQLSASAQIRVRAELRDGQGAPLPADAKPSFFISQRSRLTLGFGSRRLKLGMSLQDVRVWGQDVSSINRTTTERNNGLMLHEAWAEILFSDTTGHKPELSLRVGRQELVYDDQRLMGNLDWLQQARRHDAAIIRLKAGTYTLHGGIAFNQNGENASGTTYNALPPGNYAGNTNGGAMYKSFEYLHVNKQYAQGNISLLLFTDQFARYHTEQQNEEPVKVWESGAWSRLTTGFYLDHRLKRLHILAAAYYQGGKTSDGRKLSAALASIITQYDFHKKFSAGPAFDYSTGGSSSGESHVFDPLYGTAHKFWGGMDYFYAGSGFGNKGLADVYLTSKYQLSPALRLTGDLHRFISAGNLYDAGNDRLSRYLGTELDMVLSYAFTKTITIETGYSHFLATPSLSSAGVKNIAGPQRHNNWAYLSLNIKPDLLAKP